MSLKMDNLLKPFQVFVLFGLLTGCAVIGVGEAVMLGVTVAGAVGNSDYTPPSPATLCSNDDSIAVNYSTAAHRNQRNEAIQLISDHCTGGYIEARRLEYPASQTVYATCLQADGSPADTPPCEYDVVGFSQEDWSSVDR